MAKVEGSDDSVLGSDGPHPQQLHELGLPDVQHQLHAQGHHLREQGRPQARARLLRIRHHFCQRRLHPAHQ